MAYSLDDYKRFLRNKKNEIVNRREKNKKIKQEIDRLQKAYDDLMDIKRQSYPDAEYIKGQVKVNKLAPNVQWRGKAKNDFDKIVNNSAKDAAKSFFNSIDDMLDDVGTALYRKRGEYDTGISILNGLNSSKQWLEGIIRNWVN